MELMKSLNFAEVYDMLGGIVAWEEGGLPLINPTIQTTTAGELAILGGSVYSNTCVLTYCHEPWDADGKAEFAATSWEYFGDAQGYFDFVKRFMPGEAPGSLSDEQYLQAIAFILVELDKVQAADLFGIGNLGSISLN
jgi:hypothetical protein